MIRFPLSTGNQGLLRIWCHFKTMPDYGAEVGALIHTHNFLKNGKQSTCGFVFGIFCMVGGSLSSPVIRHSFVRDGTTARLSAGPVGHFCPTGPVFQRYSGLVSTVGVLSAATGVRAVSIVRQCLGQLSMHSPHTTQAYGSIDHVPPLRSTASAPAGQRRAHMPQQMHTSMSLTICPRKRSGAVELLLRIAHRDRLLDHGTQGRLGKCQQTHAAPTFPCS